MCLRHQLWTGHGVAAIEDQADISGIAESQTARQQRLRHFLANSAKGALPRSYDYASYYPEVVGVLSVISSSYWQSVPAASPRTAALNMPIAQ